jgi:hypothetical protein
LKTIIQSSLKVSHGLQKVQGHSPIESEDQSPLKGRGQSSQQVKDRRSLRKIQKMHFSPENG